MSLSNSKPSSGDDVSADSVFVPIENLSSELRNILDEGKIVVQYDISLLLLLFLLLLSLLFVVMVATVFIAKHSLSIYMAFQTKFRGHKKCVELLNSGEFNRENKVKPGYIIVMFRSFRHAMADGAGGDIKRAAVKKAPEAVVGKKAAAGLKKKGQEER